MNLSNFQVKFTPLLETLRLEKIDDESYFSEKFSNYISNSRLSLINPDQDNDPQAFFEGLGKHNKFSVALAMGSAVHELTLQPDLFYLSPIDSKPTAKAGAMADYLYNKENRDSMESILEASDKIDYYKGKMDDKKIEALLEKCTPYWNDRDTFISVDDRTPIYLDSKSKVQVSECVNSLANNSKVQELLHPKGLLEDPISENEQAILLDVKAEVAGKEFILKFKAKLDNYTIDKENNIITINDVKTIGKILSEFDCEGGNISKFHYSRELAVYSWLLSLCAKKYYNMENPIVKGNYLVVSTIPQYYSKVSVVTKKDFIDGWNEFTYLVKLVVHYLTEGYTFE